MSLGVLKDNAICLFDKCSLFTSSYEGIWFSWTDREALVVGFLKKLDERVLILKERGKNAFLKNEERFY